MQQILTSEIGEKWIQPEIPKLPQIGDRIESLHRLSKGERGTVTNVYPHNITYRPDNSENEIYLSIGQFTVIKEEKAAQIVKNCSNCNRSLVIEEGLYCYPKNKLVKPEGHCKKFESKPETPSNLHLVPDTPRSLTTQPETPSNSRRKKGDGSGYIQLHPTKQKGKIYEQYYYHYEIWEGGDRLNKSCVYIPKRLLAEIEAMDRAKEPITKILRALGKTV